MNGFHSKSKCAWPLCKQPRQELFSCCSRTCAVKLRQAKAHRSRKDEQYLASLARDRFKHALSFRDAMLFEASQKGHGGLINERGDRALDLPKRNPASFRDRFAGKIDKSGDDGISLHKGSKRLATRGNSSGSSFQENNDEPILVDDEEDVIWIADDPIDDHETINDHDLIVEDDHNDTSSPSTKELPPAAPRIKAVISLETYKKRCDSDSRSGHSQSAAADLPPAANEPYDAWADGERSNAQKAEREARRRAWLLRTGQVEEVEEVEPAKGKRVRQPRKTRAVEVIDLLSDTEAVVVD